jgi:hypothetical protein
MMPFFKRQFKAKEFPDDNIDKIVKYKGNLFLKIPLSNKNDANGNHCKFYSIFCKWHLLKEEMDS